MQAGVQIIHRSYGSVVLWTFIFLRPDDCHRCSSRIHRYWCGVACRVSRCCSRSATGRVLSACWVSKVLQVGCDRCYRWGDAGLVSQVLVDGCYGVL